MRPDVDINYPHGLSLPRSYLTLHLVPTTDEFLATETCTNCPMQNGCVGVLFAQLHGSVPLSIGSWQLVGVLANASRSLVRALTYSLSEHEFPVGQCVLDHECWARPRGKR